MACSKQLQLAGSAYPRTCEDCGLGPCKNPRFQAPAQVMPSGLVEIDYTNWRDERRTRIIRPNSCLVFEANYWHPKICWQMLAIDKRTGELRQFALKDVHSWKELSE
jgi:hypothetical protein